ncbi:uncharacterized protein VTP21DRAFT_4354 [Calcarisporiella thermophila]|uniref:uncharacterized protein n=1 Tax=Calcarisporiella thermophila TaxID=911321 RepID=UPI0037438B44
MKLFYCLQIKLTTMSSLVASKSIRSASLHTRLPRKLHAYVWPFVMILYPSWLYIYLFQYERFLGSGEWTFLSLGSIFTLNALTFLVCQWSIPIKAMLTCVSEKDPYKAGLIMFIPAKHKGKGALCEIHHGKPIGDEKKGELSFYFQRKKYIYNEDKKQFEKLKYPSYFNPPLSTFQNAKGLENDKQIQLATEKYSLNRFDIPMPTFQELFKEHAVAPFFVFQLFCVGLWCLDDYWYYSLFTLFMLIVFESTVVFQRLRTLSEFRSMSIKPFPIYVRRKNRWTMIQSDELVPGDLVSMVRTKEDSAVPCDMVIVNGSCIVNEAMLSGESTPLLKESIALRDPNDLLDLTGADKNNVLYGGTKVLQVTPSADSTLVAPDNGCLAYVVRTGFGTSQGKLVRTMMFSTERVTANNFEALLFILFLLIFAIIASAYVWTEGVKSDRKRSKLLLDCILIITSVVPPELPMELSLAVNTSLVALARYAIFCTEPFRIPSAGKVDVCCFDKTGTLTGESLIVEGIAGIKRKDGKSLVKAVDTPAETTYVLATAQALVLLEDGIVGDPMEKVTLEALGWKLGKNDIVEPKDNPKGYKQNLQVRRRFQFSSALKRMSTVSTLVSPLYDSTKTFVAIKGAPETLKNMFTSIPSDYEDTFKYFTKRGSRVLALGFKFLKDSMSMDQINNLSRESVESGLTFAGFLVLSCPLKEDSKQAIKMLNESSHRVIMITGDNPLTACHVAREVEIIDRDVLIMDYPDEANENTELVLKSIDESVEIPITPTDPIDPKIFDNYDLCLTGHALSKFEGSARIKDILEHTWVYARVSPSQKEYILMELKNLGYTTLMCGDGTNDVGALKQAHVGVALLDGKPEDLKKIAEAQRIQKLKELYENQRKFSERFNIVCPPPPPAIAHLYPEFQQQQQQQQQQQRGPQRRQPAFDSSQLTSQLLDGMDDEVPTIKLGDASVAAPFTSKLSNVMAIPNIIRQGRCTLVATIQMYKILALNCLISAYTLSVLYLDGIKFGDRQATISGILMSVCFLCISRARPLEKLSKQRPQTNIFNFYILLSVLGQFAVHIASLVYIGNLAKSLEPQKEVDLEKEFEPGLLNSAIYLISLSMQVSTFAINYQGHPFRERLKDNSALYWGLVVVGGIALAGATELMPEMNESLKLVPFPSGFSERLTIVMLLDFGLAWGIEFVTKALFANNRPPAIVHQ